MQITTNSRLVDTHLIYRYISICKYEI